ncbi:hypothetical protein GQ44DRAFT_726338 [Phaeosphaeriaceae sp. PMI808]|nr:hypothetical protein GQ44DRAFT_726338 [Phaeosphaeriaceae sp. PMI808]
MTNLTATQLKKNGKLRLKATNNIRRNLVLDHEERVVWIFHQDTALRMLLEATADDPNASVLPRALILEILDTLHSVIFPSNPSSYKLVVSLISGEGFDEGLLTHASTPYRKCDDPDANYTIFGSRLIALYSELQSPRPRGWLQERLGRKRDAYMLMATMIGVIIAVLVGIASSGVSVFQAWVAYQQWKHPVTGA